MKLWPNLKSSHWSERAHYWFEQVRKVIWSHFKAVTSPKINCTTTVCEYKVASWHSCVTSTIRKKTPTITCCWEKTGQNSQEWSRFNQWIRSCWKTAVSSPIHTAVCMWGSCVKSSTSSSVWKFQMWRGGKFRSGADPFLEIVSGPHYWWAVPVWTDIPEAQSGCVSVWLVW